ncbi:MAG: hypoxanthine phosphoribosyltransferase [Saprospirales bacterium]|nr:hypoxanthine phosphoribosyltransferase [Saprospirales bacterium]
MKREISVHDHRFELYLSEQQIQARVAEMGRQISLDYAGKRPVFLAILNGAFMFAADLVRSCDLDCELAFIKISSYRGLASTGKIETVLGLNVPVENRDLIIVEDIIDSGNTMRALLPDLQKLGPASVALAALLLKPECLQYPINIEYLGFQIPDRFVVGYGLDYDGLGRNLPSIYQLRQS